MEGAIQTKTGLFGENGVAASPSARYITQPENFSLVLDAFPSNNVAQMQFLQSFRDLILKCRHNGPMLMQRCRDPLRADADPFSRLVGIALRLVEQRSGRQAKACIGLIRSLVQQWTPLRHHHEFLLQKMAQHCSDKGNADIVSASLKLLQAFAHSGESDSNSPDPSYFFFSPGSHSEPSSLQIAIRKPQRLDLSRGYSFVMWFRAEEQECPHPSLLRIRSPSCTFELALSGSKLIYRVACSPGSKGDFLKVELASVVKHQWSCLGVAHGPSKQLALCLNSDEKSFYLDFPRFAVDPHEVSVCEDFCGQMSSVVIHNAPLERSVLGQLAKSLPFGVHSSSSLKNFMRVCADGVKVLLSAHRVFEQTAFNLFNGCQVNGVMRGNAGYAQICSLEQRVKYLLPVSKLVPVLEYLSKCDLQTAQKVLPRALIILQLCVQNLQTYASGTVRVKAEFRQLSEILTLFCFSRNLTLSSLGILEETIGMSPILRRKLVKGLVRTKERWAELDPSVQKKCWELIGANIHCLAPSPTLKDLLVQMINLGTACNGQCCANAMEDTRGRLNTGLGGTLDKGDARACPSTMLEPIGKVVSEVLLNCDQKVEGIASVVGAMTRPKICHCLFKSCLQVISPVVAQVKAQQIGQILTAAESQSLDLQLHCLQLFSSPSPPPPQPSAVPQGSSQGSPNLLKWMWASSKKRLAGCEGVRGEEASLQKPGEDVGSFRDEPSEDTSMLQDRVMSEEASINTAIKRIKQIKIDIQESAKSQGSTRGERQLGTELSLGREEIDQFTLSDLQREGNVQHILSIEELVAQDPYKPPPAPKNEKMGAKRFVFGDVGEREEEKEKEVKRPAVPAFKFPEAPAPQEKPKPKPRNLVLKKKLGLEIDTELINKEFDIGGEKGKKIVDEKEEEMKEEQEILELAEHCLMAMARESPNDVVRSKYASKSRFGIGISVPTTATHKSTVAKAPMQFPQSTKERKQFAFQLDAADAFPSSPIKEESSISSKSSIGPEMVRTVLSLSSDHLFAHSDLELHALIFFHLLVGNSVEAVPQRPVDLGSTLLALSDKNIYCPYALAVVMKLARKAIGTPVIGAITAALSRICERSRPNVYAFCSGHSVMKAMLKLERDLYFSLNSETLKAKNIVEFDQITTLHTLVLAECLKHAEYCGVVVETLAAWIAVFNRESTSAMTAADCFKYLWGKTLAHLRGELVKSPLSADHKVCVSAVAYLTFILIVQSNEANKEGGIALCSLSPRPSPVVPYSDSELLKLSFDFFGNVYWKDEGAIFDSEITASEMRAQLTSAERSRLCSSHLVPLLRGANEPRLDSSSGTLPSVAMLLSLALRSADGLTELENWLGECQRVLQYLSVMLEISGDSPSESESEIEQGMMLLLTTLIRMQADAYHPDEYTELISSSLAQIFKYWFALMQLPGSQTLVFYSTYLKYERGKYLVPVEEIQFAEGVGESELKQILGQEYQLLLDTGPSIQPQLRKLSSEYILQLQHEIKQLHKASSGHEDPISGENEAIMGGEKEEEWWTEAEQVCAAHNAYYHYLLIARCRKLMPKCGSTSLTLSTHEFENGMRCVLKEWKSARPAMELNGAPARTVAMVLLSRMDPRVQSKVVQPLPVSLHKLSAIKQGYALLYHRKGNEAEIVFVGQNESGTCTGIKRWGMEDLVRIYKKEVGARVAGVECEMLDGRSILLSFESEASRDLLCKKIVRLRGKWYKNLKYEGSLDPAKAFHKSLLDQEWINHKIATLDYLMICGKFAGASHNLLDQHPLLPLCEKCSASVSVGDATRDNVLAGAQRLSPFGEVIKSQDGEVEASCPLCSADVRSTIPEFFGLPEVYSKSEEDALVRSAVCPEHSSIARRGWTTEEAVGHIQTLHQELENGDIEVLQWIDAHYGVDRKPRKHSGMKQLWTRKHPARANSATLWDANAPLKQGKGPELPAMISKLEYIRSDKSEDQFIGIGVSGTVVELGCTRGKLTIKSTLRYNNNYLTNCVNADSSIGDNFPIQIIGHEKILYAVQGGYWNGGIQLSPLNHHSKSTITLNYHSSTVSAIAVDSREQIGIIGTKTGDCMIYSIKEDMFWKPLTQLLEHGAGVSSIDISNPMRLFVTAGMDGTIQLYTLSFCPRLIRKLTESSSIVFAYLVAHPLPAILYFCDSRIKCVSLNGVPVSDVEEGSIRSPRLVRDSCFNDLLVYYRDSDSSLVVRALPYLEERRAVRCPGVSAICPLPDHSASVLLHDDLRSSLISLNHS